MQPRPQPQDLFDRIGERIALDLREQAARQPAEAARAAGCGTDEEVAAWLARHRNGAAAAAHRTAAA